MRGLATPMIHLLLFALTGSFGCGGASVPCPTPTSALDRSREEAERSRTEASEARVQERAARARREEAARRAAEARARLDSLGVEAGGR